MFKLDPKSWFLRVLVPFNFLNALKSLSTVKSNQLLLILINGYIIIIVFTYETTLLSFSESN